MLMVKDDSLLKWVSKHFNENSFIKLNEIILDLERKLSRPINVVLTETRYKHVEKIFNQVVKKEFITTNSVNLWLDKYVTHPLWGIPFLLAILYIVYEYEVLKEL